MYNILTLNPISNIIDKYLDKEDYNIGSDIKNPEGIILRSASMHGYDYNDELVCIARAGAGYNNIDHIECGKKGIVVFNTPGANANGVKELAICGILLSARSIVEGINWTKTLKGKDSVAKLVEKGKKNFAGTEVAGKKIGIIGLGAVGAMVANAARSLHMEVAGYDPFMSIESALSLSRAVNRETDEEKIYAQSDYISLHLPLLPSTKNKINKEVIAKLKDGVVILNFSRGGLVDNKAMLEGLASGKVAKYVTDFPDEDLVGQDGVIAIPHLGASTVESEENCAMMAAKQIKDYIENGNITNSVNIPACSQPRSGQYRITIIHENIKNMVGQITVTLAEEDHNITNMMNKSHKDIAYTMIDVDDVIGETCIVKLKAIKGIIKIRTL